MTQYVPITYGWMFSHFDLRFYNFLWKTHVFPKETLLDSHGVYFACFLVSPTCILTESSWITTSAPVFKLLNMMFMLR